MAFIGFGIETRAASIAFQELTSFLFTLMPVHRSEVRAVRYLPTGCEYSRYLTSSIFHS